MTRDAVSARPDPAVPEARACIEEREAGLLPVAGADGRFPGAISRQGIFSRVAPVCCIPFQPKP